MPEQISQEGYREYRPRCRFCGSTRVVKRGVSKTAQGTIQRYYCLRCSRRFIHRPEGFHWMRHNPETVYLALDLYRLGLPLKDVVRQLNEIHGVGITKSTLFYWIKKFSKIARVEERTKPTPKRDTLGRLHCPICGNILGGLRDMGPFKCSECGFAWTRQEDKFRPELWGISPDSYPESIRRGLEKMKRGLKS